MIIDHIGMAISDYEKSKKFYSKVLAPLGIELVTEVQEWAGFGKNGKPEFWFGVHEKAQYPMHIAFSASSREEVNKFYEVAILAGAKDNGKPGVREIYHPNYYGAPSLIPMAIMLRLFATRKKGNERLSNIRLIGQ